MMFLRSVYVLILVGSCLSDEGPCLYEELKGEWMFEVSEGGHDETIDCKETGKIARRYRLFLEYPDVVRDEFGNVGFWTTIGGLQTFEVVVQGRKFFAISFPPDPTSDQQVERLCNATGWSHNVLVRDWACFVGHKITSNPPPSVPRTLQERRPKDIHSANNDLTRKDLRRRLYRTDADMVDSINAAQSSWTATTYDEYDTMTVDQLLSRAGNRLKRKNSVVTPAPVTKEKEKLAAGLPDSFDWRYVKGINYVTPVRHQGTCGSCYAFASTAMNEARLAIFNNTRSNPIILSPQDVVDCCNYTYGCDGGNSYLVAGKYAEEYGMVEESCNPYKNKKSPSCKRPTQSSCKRYYFTGYEYIGGYYGACNEAEMMLALVNYGPLVIAFEFKEDFMFYNSGIYSPTGISSKFDPTVEVNHEVTLIGYGVDQAIGKYWVIKNSWGPDWGEKGFFRMRRGINECGVESDAMQSFPIF